jgi:hypothetical protein
MIPTKPNFHYSHCQKVMAAIWTAGMLQSTPGIHFQHPRVCLSFITYLTVSACNMCVHFPFSLLLVVRSSTVTFKCCILLGPSRFLTVPVLSELPPTTVYDVSTSLFCASVVSCQHFNTTTYDISFSLQIYLFTSFPSAGSVPLAFLTVKRTACNFQASGMGDALSVLNIIWFITGAYLPCTCFC